MGSRLRFSIFFFFADISKELKAYWLETSSRTPWMQNNIFCNLLWIHVRIRVCVICVLCVFVRKNETRKNWSLRGISRNRVIGVNFHRRTKLRHYLTASGGKLAKQCNKLQQTPIPTEQWMANFQFIIINLIIAYTNERQAKICCFYNAIYVRIYMTVWLYVFYHC